jgi:hypothetical protein
MDLNEFKDANTFLKQLKEESTSRELNSIKSAEFYSIISAYVTTHPKLRYRDNLEVDNTFAVVVHEDDKFGVTESIEIYMDICDLVKTTTYTQIRNTGFIDLGKWEGFWILVR